MNIFDLLKGQLNDQVLDQLSQQIGAPKQQTQSAADAALAAILGGMANNAQSTNGLQGLLGALDKDHDGSILDDLTELITKGAAGQATANPALNGAGILKHILGDKQEVAAQQISQNSGLQMSQVMKLLPILAPLVMGVLGQQKRQGGMNVGDLAQILMGGAQQAGSQSGLGGLLGQVLGGVLNQGGAQQQQPQAQQNPMGGLLGKVLGGFLKGRK